MSTSKWKSEYKSKLISPEEAAKKVKSGDRLTLPPSPGEPRALCRAIARRAETGEFTDVEVDNVYTLGTDNPIWDAKLKKNIKLTPLFVTTAQRWATDDGSGEFTPVYFQDCPRLYERGYRSLDIFIAEASPMDKHGYFNFGASVAVSKSSAKVAKMVILEVNENQPVVYGDGFIHISDVDFIVENNEELPTIGSSPISDKDKVMGRYIADLIPNGATIQIGVGGVPSAVCKFLKDKRDLGIHTECFSDTMLELIEEGIVTNKKKNIHNGKSLFTFAIGSKSVYDYMDRNPAIESYQVSYTNNPQIIAQHDNMIAVNAAIQVDLTGQCCSEAIGWRQFSGVGGQADFCRGSYLSEGGKNFICLYSTAKGGTVCTIVSSLSPGAKVSAQRQSVMYIVTEYGVATMIGKSIKERARELINIAHPNFREQLTAEAKKMMLL